jgi:hypothetical protein
VLTSRRVIDRIERHAVAVIAVVAIAAYCWVYTRPDADPPIRSDGYNYYLYAASWVVYHDVSLEAVATDWNGGAYPDFAGMIRWPGTSHWVNRIPIGVSILMVPFVVAAHLLSKWSNFPADAYSFYYQHAAGLAGLSYFVTGLWILRRMLRRHFSSAVTLASIVVLTFGTDLFHYGVNESTFSHAFSFALVAALVALADLWWAPQANSNPAVSIAIGVVAGLIVLVRHTNALLLLIVPLWQMRRVGELWTRRRDLLTIAAVGTIVLTPQLAYDRWAAGSWVVNAYARHGVHFAFASPHLTGALFSPARGLFFWAPSLLCAVAGLFLARGWAADVRPGAGIVLVLNAWLIASWSEWQYGAAFGHRAFIDSFPIVAILLASCFQWVAARPRIVPAVTAAVTLAVALSTAQMIQYWLHVWPTRDITWDQYRALFLTFR